MRVSDKARKAWASSFRSTDPEGLLAVALPECTEQLQSVVHYCLEHDIPAFPRGAGTNLVGAINRGGEHVLIATTRMREVLGIDEVSGTVRVQAGVTNRAVSEHARPFGWRYAPDPSSQRTCTIGGNIATNSSGASALKYGTTANNLLGLTVVLPDGEIITTTNDDLGISLTGLLCGSEGQMGFVTEALLRLVPLAPETRTILLAFSDCEDGLRAAARILKSGVLPSRFDFLDRECALMCENYTTSGYPDEAGGVLLLDIEGNAEQLDALQARILSISEESSTIRIEVNPNKRARLWAGRMKIYGAAAAKGRHVMLDGAVPLSQAPAILQQIGKVAKHHSVMPCTTLHIGDGTVHTFLHQYADESIALYRCARDIRLACVSLGGTLSAEYGIGTQHHDLLDQQFSTTDLAVQNRLLAAIQTNRTMGTSNLCPSVLEAAS